MARGFVADIRFAKRRHAGFFPPMSNVEEIEIAIERLDLREQVQLLRDLPARLKISFEDVATLRNAESAFGFWENSEDAVYDDL